MSSQLLPSNIEKYADYDTRESFSSLFCIFKKIMIIGGVYDNSNLEFRASKLKDTKPRYIAEITGFSNTLSLRNLISLIDNFSPSAKDINIELRAKEDHRLVFVIPNRVMCESRGLCERNREREWDNKEKQLELLVETFQKRLKEQNFYKTILYKKRFWRVYMERVAKDVFQHFNSMCIQCNFHLDKLDEKRICFGIQFTQGMETIDLRTLDYISNKHKEYVKNVEIVPGTMTIQFNIVSSNKKQRNRFNDEISSDEEYHKRKKRSTTTNRRNKRKKRR